MYRDKVLTIAEEISAEAHKPCPSIDKVRGLSQQLCTEAEHTAAAFKFIQDIATHGRIARRTLQWAGAMETTSEG